MRPKQFVVVVYDINVDARRTKLHTALLAFGTPVQYSVFECWVTAAQLKQLQARVKRIVRPRKDHVRYYFLCANCAGQVRTTQAGELTTIKDVVIV